MKNIKFRAWDINKKEMFFPDFIGGYPEKKYYKAYENIDCEPPYEIDGAIIMQFIGIKDKYDIDIYEGDIVRTLQSEFEVYWNKDKWGLKNDDGDYDNGDYYCGFVINWDNDVEVIGNINIKR